MKPPPFDYIRTETVAETTALLDEYQSEARILAGGQSLLAMLNMRLTRPQLVLDITGVVDLAGVSITATELVVGAGVTQASILNRPDLMDKWPLLAKALPHVGHPQTRTRGTLAGSIAQSDPAAELPLVLAVMGGSVDLESRNNRRSFAGRAFQTGMLSTACNTNEMIVATRWPTAQPGAGYGFREFARRKGDFALVTAAAKVTADSITMGIGGAAPIVVVETWPVLCGTDLDDALNRLAWSIPCQDDAHTTAAHRRHLIRKLGRHCVDEAFACRS